MVITLPKPTIFAHRGSSSYAPENTLAAFDLAVSHKADAIELDAKLCGDQQIVVFHDQTLDRTTDTTGRISNIPLEALKELDAGGHFDMKFTGERIPTLDEVFEAVGKKIFINVELTNYESPMNVLAEKVASCVQRHNLKNQVLFSSFNPVVLRRIKKLIPTAPVGLLALPGFSGLWARSVLGRWGSYQALHPEKQDIRNSLLDKYHQRCMRVHTYTVNRADTMMTLYQMGIDGIFTDDPPLARKTLAEFYEKNDHRL